MSIAATLNDPSIESIPYQADLEVDVPSVQGDLRYNEPMSRHTSWRTGGLADVYYRATNEHDLAAFVRDFSKGIVGNTTAGAHNSTNTVTSKSHAITWVGLGSNLLVRDGGIRGAVIKTHQCLSSIELVSDGLIHVGAGVPCAKLARRSIRFGLSGAEFFAGIPGTVGGALAMNAGAFGGETWSVIEDVTTLSVTGEIRQRRADEYQVGYRRVTGPNNQAHHDQEWFLSARIRLVSGDEAVSREQIRSLLLRRAQSQPIQTLNAGSVFRNPADGFAAQLIEAAGLKGLRRGGAVVSMQHANFIVNDNQATAADIEGLINTVQERVAAHSGVVLEPEVRIVGEALE